MRIGPIDTEDAVAVIAEIGNNHEGDPDVALELTRAAARAGAHAVKFQAMNPDHLISPDDTARIEQLRRFQLSPDQFARLRDEAHGLGLGFLCTPFDLGGAAWLAPLVDAFKIASADNDFVALIDAVASSGKPVIVSGGMTDATGLIRAREIVDSHGSEFAALHCVSSYPTPPEAASLATIPRLAATVGGTIGYSDHTLGSEACVLAVALGARIIEKHLTLRHDFSDFRDHQLSAEPSELADLIRRVEHAQVLLGTPRVGVLPCEEAIDAAARRSIAAARDLPTGHILSWEDLEWLRPGGGLSPGREDEVLGRELAVPVVRGTPLAPDHFAD